MFWDQIAEMVGKILATLGCIALCLGLVAVFLGNASAHFFANGIGLVILGALFISIGNIENAVVEILEIQKQMLDYQKKTYLATVEKTTSI